MRSLAEILAGEWVQPQSAQLFCDLLGPTTPAALARQVEGAIAAAHGPVRSGLFAAISVGAVFGVETMAGERLVLKIYPRHFAQSTLASVHGVQRRLDALGFPVPRLRGDLLELGGGLSASIADFVEGEEEGGHDPGIIAELGGALARLSGLAERENLPLIGGTEKPARRLWPVPHKSTIRLAETSKGAGFLRDRAVRARSVLRDARGLPQRLMHMDWGVKNVRFRAKKILVVFDWDSLGTAPEAVGVGRAAAQFAAHWDIPTKITPSPAEAQAFVAAYELERGRKFSALERRVAAAAADLHIAGIARQEWGEGVRSGDNTFIELCRMLGAKSLLSG